MGNLNAWEIIILVLIALFIFGPERLPRLIGDGVRLLRRLRSMARNATDDLSRELGTELTLEDLNPKTFIRKHVLSDDEQAALRRPLDDLARDVRGVGTNVRGVASDVRRAGATPLEKTAPGTSSLDTSPLDTSRPDDSGETRPTTEQPRRHEPDPDAT